MPPSIWVPPLSLRVSTMRAYVITTGLIFGAITIAHFARFATEPHVRTEIDYIVLTAIAAGLTGWSAYLVRRTRPAQGQ